MKVVVVGLNYEPEHAGIAPYTTGTARALAEAGHDVHVVTGFPYYPQWRTADDYRGVRAGLARRLRDGDVRLTRLRHYVPSSSTGIGRIAHEASFAVHAWLRTRGREFRDADVVIGVSPSLLSLVAARALATRTRAAFGVVVQDLYASASDEVGALGGRGGSQIARLEAGLLRSADGVVTIHERFGEVLRRRHGVSPDRITIIRNWTHIPLSWAPVPAPWPSGTGTVVLHAGNMGAKQELGTVVDAARLADRRGDDVRFVLVGDGARCAELRRQAEGVRRISVLPPVPDAEFAGVLAAADVLLVNERPGLRSVCVPSKLTSYFAAGRPVLAATEEDSPASAELSAAGAGVRVPPGDPAALLDAALRLGDDSSLCERLGRNGRDYALTALCKQQAGDRYRAWVAELAGRGGR
ncbi:glycosyltransferase family 4 protein [Lentzea sp. NPDC060358]|uniref:glycosyltransferase family 4 protein n=1 Tax=Lentzea sp. NPDC060358 TaxID=3347103 RepID=UPI003667801D